MLQAIDIDNSEALAEWGRILADILASATVPPAPGEPIVVDKPALPGDPIEG